MEMDWSDLPKFSDFAEPQKQLEGDKIKIESVLGQDIVVTGYRIAKSKVKTGEDCLTIQFVLKGENVSRVVFTGSRVLADQVRIYESNIPFRTKIQQVGSYYTFQ